MRLRLLLALIVLLPFTGFSRATSDSAACREQFSLYREYYKIKLYSHALPHWRWVFNNCPTTSQNTYIDGVKIVSSYIDELKDNTLKEKVIDTLMMVYDKRIQYFGREGYVLGRKAIDLLTYRPNNTAEAYAILAKSIELQGNKSDAAVLVYYLNTSIQLATAGKIDKSEIFAVYDKTIAISEANISANASDATAQGNWIKTKTSIEAIIEPHASCTDLVAIYSKKFKETPNDAQLLKNITNMLDKRNCTTEGDLFYKATENLHKLEPSAQSAYLMGKLCIQNNQFTKATEYMSQAVEMFNDTTEKIKALYALASLHMNNKNYSQARATAYKILQLKPNEGKAYILIGDMYALSASLCDDDNLGGKSVFWAATDKYIKAKSVDNSVESVANEKISLYARYFPATSDLFFRDMQEGKSFTVGGWINETTIIRGIK